MKWHGRPAREITRKMRVPQQQNTRKLTSSLRVFFICGFPYWQLAASNA